MTDEQLKVDLRLRHPGADDGFEVEDFVWRYGSALDALMYARLFWPAFFLEKGMIFTAHAVKDHGALSHGLESDHLSSGYD